MCCRITPSPKAYVLYSTVHSLILRPTAQTKTVFAFEGEEDFLRKYIQRRQRLQHSSLQWTVKTANKMGLRRNQTSLEVDSKLWVHIQELTWSLMKTTGGEGGWNKPKHTDFSKAWRGTCLTAHHPTQCTGQVYRNRTLACWGRRA